MILRLNIKNAHAHRKGLKTKNWRHFFMKTYVWCKLNLQNHLELITQQFWNIWKHLEWFSSKDIRCCTSWNRETSNGRKGKVFCIVSWQAMKSEYSTITLSVEDRWVSPVMHQHRWQSLRKGMNLSLPSHQLWVNCSSDSPNECPVAHSAGALEYTNCISAEE